MNRSFVADVVIGWLVCEELSGMLRVCMTHVSVYLRASLLSCSGLICIDIYGGITEGLGRQSVLVAGAFLDDRAFT